MCSYGQPLEKMASEVQHISGQALKLKVICFINVCITVHVHNTYLHTDIAMCITV